MSQKLKNFNVKDLITVFSGLKRGFGEQDWSKADGMIATLITLGLSQLELKVLLKVGGSRVSRITKQIDLIKRGLINETIRIKPTHAVTKDQIDFIASHMNSFEFEEGFSCSHRLQKFYLTDPGITWKSIYEKYASRAFSEKQRTLSFSCWRQKVIELFPNLRLTRVKEDECNTCFELKTLLLNPTLTELQRKEIQDKLDSHIQEAKTQRLEMNNIIRQYCSREIGLDLPDRMDLLPQYKDAPIEDLSADETNAFAKNGILVQAEDFGGAIPLPIYLNRRPAASFFSSSVMINNFVVACPSLNKNFVFVFDERAQDRNADAMCSLRLVYHLNMFLYHKQSNSLLLKSLTILDNCTAQNKSKVVFMFFAALQILFYEDGFHLLFLKPGHSHMVADRIVGQCRQSFKGLNIFHPSQLVDCFNRRKTIEAIFINHLKDDKLIWKGFENVLNKYFIEMPSGFTDYYSFIFMNGCVTMKRLSTDSSFSKFNLLKNFKATDINKIRSSLLDDFFGVSSLSELNSESIHSLRLEKPVTKSYNEAKSRSLVNLLKYIPSVYHYYYPSAGESQKRSISDVIETPEQEKIPFFPERRKVGRPKNIETLSRGQTVLTFNSMHNNENEKENLYNESISSSIWS